MHVLAAVGSEVGARNEGRILGGQEAYQGCDFLGLSKAPHRYLRNDLVADLLGDGHHHFGGDIAGRYRIYRNSLACHFLSKRHSEAMDTGLGRRVVGLTELSLLAVD